MGPVAGLAKPNQRLSATNLRSSACIMAWRTRWSRSCSCRRLISIMYMGAKYSYPRVSALTPGRAVRRFTSASGTGLNTPSCTSPFSSAAARAAASGMTRTTMASRYGLPLSQ